MSQDEAPAVADAVADETTQALREATAEDKEEDGTPRRVHKLESPWTLYFDKKLAPGQDYDHFQQNLKRLGSFSTLEEFWMYTSYLKDPAMLPNGHDEYMFRHNYIPAWETFPNGGCWIIKVRKWNGLINRMWEELMFACVGELFEEPDIVGIVLSVRNREDIISVWNRDNTLPEIHFKIGQKLKSILNLDESTQVEYKHFFSSLRDGSTFRNAKAYVYNLKASQEAEKAAEAVQKAEKEKARANSVEQRAPAVKSEEKSQSQSKRGGKKHRSSHKNSRRSYREDKSNGDSKKAQRTSHKRPAKPSKPSYASVSKQNPIPPPATGSKPAAPRRVKRGGHRGGANGGMKYRAKEAQKETPAPAVAAPVAPVTEKVEKKAPEKVVPKPKPEEKVVVPVVPKKPVEKVVEAKAVKAVKAVKAAEVPPKPAVTTPPKTNYAAALKAGLKRSGKE